MTEETTEHADLLTQDAHLSELTLNRFDAGELGDAEIEFVEQHLVDCSACKARHEAVHSFDGGFSIAPPAALVADVSDAENDTTSNVVSLDDKRPNRNWIAMVLAAAAAIAMVYVARGDQPARIMPNEPNDGIRIKGSGLALEVFAKTGDANPRRVGKGDVVHPGDRLGFKVTSREAGHAMVVGIDDAGQVYAGWPQGSGAKSKFVEAQDGPRDVEAAIVLDDVGASETLVLIRCPDSFDIAAASKRLKERTSLDAKQPRDPMSQCAYDEVPLKKQPR